MKLAITNAVTLTVYAVLLAMGTAVLYLQWQRFQSVREWIPSGNVGAAMSQLGLSRHERTLVLALKIGCQYCERSMPFYRRLVAEGRSRPTQSAFLQVALPDEAKLAENYLKIQGLDVPFVAGLNLADLRISGTPTVLLLSANGDIKKAWVGALEPSAEQEVMSVYLGDRRRTEAGSSRVRGARLTLASILYGGGAPNNF